MYEYVNQRATVAVVRDAEEGLYYVGVKIDGVFIPFWSEQVTRVDDLVERRRFDPESSSASSEQ